jgi:F0F1-type ATP synthase membrane subunit b/b'
MKPSIQLLTFYQWRHTIIFLIVNGFIIIVVLWLFLFPIISFFSERSERISEQLSILSRYEDVAMQEQQVEEYSRKVSDNNDKGELILGPTEGIANANLQERLQEIAQNNNMNVKSIQTIQKKTIGVASLIGSKIEVSGTFERLYVFLRSLETSSPLLIISSATIVPQSPIQEQSNPTQIVDAELDIYAGTLTRSDLQK